MSVVEEFRGFVRAARAARVRSMRGFAEAEVVLPDGPFKGRRFRCDRQPYAGLFFDVVDSGRFRVHVLTGCVQSGKTTVAFCIPQMYFNFERAETVICGLPSMDMAADKWAMDLKPMIEASRYRDLLPRSGPGARGGTPNLIRFGNGAALKFMGAGGGDDQRSAFTSRVVIMTEVDKFDDVGEASDEADPVTQMVGRTKAYGEHAAVFMECTVTFERGRIWQEYLGGSHSRIATRCPHCGVFVTLEREDLKGWEDAGSEVEAERGAAFFCSGCGERWSEGDRRRANLDAVLLHEGEEVSTFSLGKEKVEPKETEVVGNAPDVFTLGFRWSAVNNLFVSAGLVGAQEWRKLHSVEEDVAERALCQFVWAVPAPDAESDVVSLDAREIAGRMGRLGRGVVPDDVVGFSVGLDLGKYVAHWVAVAESPVHRFVVDYGVVEVPGHSMETAEAVGVGLREFRERAFVEGWVSEGGRPVTPGVVVVDSGSTWTEAVYRFCKGAGPRWVAGKGFGVSQRMERKYSRPRNTSTLVRWIGDGCHLARVKSASGTRTDLLEFDADRWKTAVHEGFGMSVEEAGSVVLFRAGRDVEHLTFGKHLTAEKQVEIFEPGVKGLVTAWEQVRRQNHFLDGTVMGLVGLNYLRKLEQRIRAGYGQRVGGGGGGKWFG